MPSLMWFREDLRIHDNTALYHATHSKQQSVIALYIISSRAWQLHDIASCRVDFILRNLKILSESLHKLNIPLLIRQVDSDQAIPDVILNISQTFNIHAIYCNQQYELDEARRDLAVETLCRKNHIAFFSYTDQVILAPGEVLTAQHNYYSIFTPFKKAWLQQLSQQTLHIFPAPNKQTALEVTSDQVPTKITGFEITINPTLWPAGETVAQQRLQQFINDKITHYDTQRDLPALTGTSQLSPYLTTGVLSPRQCLQAALAANKNQLSTGNSGILTWINELIWREFYKHILHSSPRVSMHQAFKLETEQLKWRNNAKQFDAWCEGKTGYPLIDAAMRQLNQMGWMHNRLRMLVAMFLVKDLWIDWRWGEKYFMQHLIDGDLAANNGGWQWAASTGTDAVPYFRIFNPITQSEKFDPDSEFIRRYCPELASLDNKIIHNPPSLLRQQLNYPPMLVDHAEARNHALQQFKNLSQK